jgi:predicted HTH transcriptional regulator
MHWSEIDLATISRTHYMRSGTDVEQRRRIIVALLQQHQDGMTPREIREATGLSKALTESALSGLFTRSIVHKHGNRYVLTA